MKLTLKDLRVNAGFTIEKASKELGISYKAFDGHVQRIKKKLRKAVYEADAGL